MKKRISGEVDMKKFGEHIGRLLRGGEALQLVGDVGAGKTTFAKGLAVGLGIDETVQSPTFTISRLYEGREGIRLAHYDFYRLSDPGIMAEELKETSSDEKTVICIEWGDIVRDVVENDFLEIVFASPTETSRELVLMPHGDRSEGLLERVETSL